jgi:hypothetical protein
MNVKNLIEKDVNYYQENFLNCKSKRDCFFIWKKYLSFETFLFSRKYNELLLYVSLHFLLNLSKVIELAIIIRRLNHRFWIWYFLFRYFDKLEKSCFNVINSISMISNLLIRFFLENLFKTRRRENQFGILFDHFSNSESLNLHYRPMRFHWK